LKVLDFNKAKEKKVEADKELQMTEKCRNLNALISELSLVIEKHVNLFGTTFWQASGASMYCLANALANSDPELKHPGIRDKIHDLLDLYTDDALVQLWESKGDVP
jgi:hypothetical protein